MSVELDGVRRFLADRFGAPAGVTPVGAGMFSRAFAFDAGGAGYVLRINRFEEDFRKDAYAAQRFAGAPALPIPRVVEIGRFDAARFYCITERCDGVTVDGYGPDAFERLLPAIFEALDAVHAADTSGMRGWGLTRAGGHGRFPSWPHYALSLFNQKFDMDWPRITAAPFWDARLFDACYGAMRRLLDAAPARKWLLHGDFAGPNLVARGEALTGVLDWAEMRLGDCVADVAYLGYWDAAVPVAELWRERQSARGVAVPDFDARLRCCRLHTALGGMIIAALHNDEAEHAAEAARAERLLRGE